jgi:NADH dehydrogenase (ubiquinone) flavoprotein 2
MSAGMAAADGFEFTAENRRRVDAIIARYPEGRQQSAVLPLLDLAQRQCGGWLPRAAIEHVAAVLGMARIRVEEVVSFYTMLFDKPVGRHVVWVCTTTPCWLRGSDAILNRCRKTLGIEVGETSADGAFTLLEAECLGACVNAPMVQVNDDYYEDLDPDSMQRVLDALKRGEAPKPGSQAGRRSSEPAGGPTTPRRG